MAITADIGTLQRLPTIIGHGRATELALTARTFKGPDAEDMGLVTQCFQDESSMMTAVESVAKSIAAKSPLAVLGTKRVLLHARDHTVADGLEYVATWNAAVLPSHDLTEVFDAVVRQKGQPRFAKL